MITAAGALLRGPSHHPCLHSPWTPPNDSCSFQWPLLPPVTVCLISRTTLLDRPAAGKLAPQPDNFNYKSYTN